MKIKQLFKKLDEVNEIVREFDEKLVIKFYATGLLDDEEFDNYNDFVKFVKEFFNVQWEKYLLKDCEIYQNGKNRYDFYTYIDIGCSVIPREYFAGRFIIAKKY